MSKTAAWICVALLLVANILRFVHLDADFPSGVTTSRALYTDEGLYSMNGLNLGTGQPWYIPGELNAIINLPVAPLLQAAIFRTFGPTLIVARAVAASAAIVLLVAAFILTRRHAPLSAAVLVAVVISLDFLLFSYSRIALFDVIMATMVALAFVGAVTPGRSESAATLAGTLAAAAILTKTIAIGALPAVAYLSTTQTADPARKRRLAAITLATALGLAAVYNLLAWNAYPVDYIYFHHIAETRLATNPLQLLRNVGLAVVNTIRFDPWLSITSLGLTAALYRSSLAFRSNALTRTALIWVVGILIVLSITEYQPSRYFVAFVVPLAMLLALGLMHVDDLAWPQPVRAIVPALLLACVLVPNGWHIGVYSASPRYTFVQMAREVGAIVRGPTAGTARGALLGNMAATVSLEANLTAVSLEYGTTDLASRVSGACPSHFITLATPGEDEHQAVAVHYAIESVKEWTVFDNYYEHRPVRLFRLRPLTHRLDGCSWKDRANLTPDPAEMMRRSPLPVAAGRDAATSRR